MIFKYTKRELKNIKFLTKNDLQCTFGIGSKFERLELDYPNVLLR